MMKHIEVTIRGMPVDYPTATSIARAIAGQLESEPTLVAWHDAKEGRMSPAIEGADVHSRWLDYGESHGADFAVSLNGEYDFIFADTSQYETLEHSPYLAVRDSQGHQFLCLAKHLRDPKNPSADACFSVEDSSFGALHEG
jgi:hypothetical protein